MLQHTSSETFRRLAEPRRSNLMRCSSASFSALESNRNRNASAGTFALLLNDSIKTYSQRTKWRVSNSGEPNRSEWFLDITYICREIDQSSSLQASPLRRIQAETLRLLRSDLIFLVSHQTFVDLSPVDSSPVQSGLGSSLRSLATLLLYRTPSCPSM